MDFGGSPPLLFTASSHVEMGKAVAACLGIELGRNSVYRHPSGELSVYVRSNVRGRDTFVLTSICPPRPNDHLMELLLTLDAIRRQAPQRITLVLPYLAYQAPADSSPGAHQQPSRLVAKLLKASGCHRMIGVNAYQTRIAANFERPVDDIHTDPILHKWLDSNVGSFCVVAARTETVSRCSDFACMSNADLAMVVQSKRRPSHVVGKVSGRKVVIFDDVLDDPEALVDAAEVCAAEGATHIYIAATHALLSNPQRLTQCPHVTAIVTTDTVPWRHRKPTMTKLVVLSVAPIIGETIRRVHNGESLHLMQYSDTYIQLASVRDIDTHSSVGDVMLSTDEQLRRSIAAQKEDSTRVEDLLWQDREEGSYEDEEADSPLLGTTPDFEKDALLLQSRAVLATSPHGIHRRSHSHNGVVYVEEEETHARKPFEQQLEPQHRVHHRDEILHAGASPRRFMVRSSAGTSGADAPPAVVVVGFASSASGSEGDTEDTDTPTSRVRRTQLTTSTPAWCDPNEPQ